MNCVEILFLQDLDKSNKPALVYFDSLDAINDPNKNLSFQQFFYQIGKAQNSLLNYRLNQEDACLIFETPSPSLYVMVTALLSMGIKVLLVEPWLPVNEIDHIIRTIKPKLMITEYMGRVLALKSREIQRIPNKISSKKLIARGRFQKASFRDVEKTHPGILTFTSGTTGKSKGVVRTHEFLVNQREVIANYMHYEQFPGLDLTVFTNLALLNIPLGKGSLVLPKWNKDLIQVLPQLNGDFKIDTLATAPKFLNHILDWAPTLKIDQLKVGGALSDIKLLERAQTVLSPSRFVHVYGSTEAEPVAFCEMKEAISKSKEKNYFQCLMLGRPISEITLMQRDSIWVAGRHVSTFYQGDEEANKKNKFIDENKTVFHNMGDRVLIEKEELWYAGRDFQTHDNFLLEQRVYQQMSASSSFIHQAKNEKVWIGESNISLVHLKNKFTEIDRFIKVPKIMRDRRHQSRIDRVGTLKKYRVK